MLTGEGVGGGAGRCDGPTMIILRFAWTPLEHLVRLKADGRNTSKERADDFTLLRCAEKALEADRTSFTVTNYSDHSTPIRR